MVMIELCEDEKEKLRHDWAVQRLVSESGLPAKEVDTLYERALRELKKEARVKEYLTILASRRVKDLLKGNGRAA